MAAILIDQYLPRFDVREQHSIRVKASLASTYAALATTDFSKSRVMQLLVLLRRVPAMLTGERSLMASRAEPITLASMESAGFRMLATRPPHEMVIGIEGQFWRPTGAVCTPPEQAFASEMPPAGFARAVWNFSLTPIDETCSHLATETRVLCADAHTRWRFLPYWYVIRAGSGLIRHAMLRAIRETAEASSVIVT